VTFPMYTNVVTTYMKHTPYGPLYLACGPGWGPLTSRSPLNVVYFVQFSDGRAPAVRATLAEASYDAAWARLRENVSYTLIVRNDGQVVQEDCDACGDYCEAELSKSSSGILEYLCKNCRKAKSFESVRWEQAKPGRPKGSGIYPTREDLLQDVRPIIQRLRQQGEYPSRARVAACLLGGTKRKDPDRQLGKWVKQWGLTWNDVLKSSKSVN
jgi:hypothetical protein